jgi:hypothetical protein
MQERQMSEKHRFESQYTEDRRDSDGHVLRAFLVACHEADVSVGNMSRYLGIEEHAVRAELLIGLRKWRAAHGHEGAAFVTEETRGSAVSPA